MENLNWNQELEHNHNHEVVTEDTGTKLNEEQLQVLAQAGMSMEEFSATCKKITQAFYELTMPVVEACKAIGDFLVEAFRIRQSNERKLIEATGKGLVPYCVLVNGLGHRKERIRKKNVNRALRELRIAKKRRL